MYRYILDFLQVFGYGRNQVTGEVLMDTQDMQRVIALYREEFDRLGVKKKDFPHFEKLIEPWRGLEHCYAMLDKMERFLEEGEIEKAFRWLGFIQGYLWSCGIYRLDELMKHNKNETQG